MIMVTTTISDFRKSIKSYVDTVIATHEPVLISRGQQGAVLVSLEEYNALSLTASALNSPAQPAKESSFIEVDIDTL